MKRIIAVVMCLLALGLASCAQEPPAPSPDSEGVMLAVFEGMADPHTIEVYVDGEPVALQLEGEALNQAGSFEKGDEVYIHYERRDGVLYAYDIEEVSSAQ